MKNLKKKLSGLFFIVALAIVLLYLFDYDYILKGVRVVYLTGHSTAYIDDYLHFDNRIIKKGDKSIQLPIHKKFNTATSTDKLNAINDTLGTIALLVLKNDSIWYEKYAEGYGTGSYTNSFSMAKSITTSLLGKAIMDGYIKNMDQPVGFFFRNFLLDWLLKLP